jgi:hypothetical protein
MNQRQNRVLQILTLGAALKCLVFMMTFFLTLQCYAFSVSTTNIHNMQSMLQNQPIGERIAFWAERFIGTPYDRDPLGIYVTRKTIVADNAVDCMYLVFRATELALSDTPKQAIDVALDKRFFTHGIIKNGLVTNYDQRFQYGEDMITSGKWGREITAELGGKVVAIPGTRGHDSWDILPTSELRTHLQNLQTGDLIFFIRDPQKRSTANESVGHMGIIAVEMPRDGKIPQVYLINAHGTKQKGGKVVKVRLNDYLQTMPFIGVQVTRFENGAGERT